MNKLKITTEGSDVIVLFNPKTDVVAMRWPDAEQVWQTLRLAARKAGTAGAPSAIATNDVTELGIRVRDGRVALCFPRRIDRLILPFDAATDVWRSLRQATKQAEAWGVRGRTAEDAAIVRAEYDRLRERYCTPADHARFDAGIGVVYSGLVGQPRLLGQQGVER
jgi:hypothetical protein